MSSLENLIILIQRSIQVAQIEMNENKKRQLHWFDLIGTLLFVVDVVFVAFKKKKKNCWNKWNEETTAKDWRSVFDHIQAADCASLG